jgi:hypothetical protein
VCKSRNRVYEEPERKIGKRRMKTGEGYVGVKGEEELMRRWSGWWCGKGKRRIIILRKRDWLG